jgi:predicted dehydrogenase
MGPYYFSALVSLLGPITGVAARGSRWRTERYIHTGPRAGESFPVEVPSTVQVLSTFEGGQHGTHLLSFDSALERLGVIEIHGSEGSLILPDPNRFEGRIAYVKPVGVIRDGIQTDQEWIEIAQHGTVVGRGLGVLDMARAIAEDRPHLASGELGYHVLDVLLSAQESAATGQYLEIESTVAKVPLLPDGFDPFARTLV